jgi:hypothetical protein
MSTDIKLKRSSVAGKAPTTGQLELGEIAINTNDGAIFLKREYFSESANSAVEEIVKFVSSVPVDGVIYVQKAGNDENDGLKWDSAVLTLERAMEIATNKASLTLIDIAPGTYETRGHLDMPDNTMIRCAYRTVYIRPEAGYEERNVFRMGDNCFIEGPVFEGWRLDSLDNPTEGFAVSFRPGALITRAPYVHKITVRTDPYWTTIAPPLDRNNANPLVGVGAGVAIADGLVCSPYSVYPNIMTWGATPVSHNGIGYVAKNGALINAVNAISIWAHKHFLAQDGGQLILSGCSTQFGDYTMIAEGVRYLINPVEIDSELVIDTTAADAIMASANTIIDDMWDDLVVNNYTVGWNAEDEVYTRRDAASFLRAISWVLQSANEKPMLDFAKGLFDTQGNEVFSGDKLAAFVHSFEFMRDEIKALPSVGTVSDGLVDELVSALNSTISSPSKIPEPSTITAIGHTWTAIMAGVALTKIPPATNFATIEESILELDNGIVIASGQDDQGSALFIGGMKIDADTGELTGPPFEQSVNRIATRTAIARSF